MAIGSLKPALIGSTNPTMNSTLDYIYFSWRCLPLLMLVSWTQFSCIYSDFFWVKSELGLTRLLKPWQRSHYAIDINVTNVQAVQYLIYSGISCIKCKRWNPHFRYNLGRKVSKLWLKKFTQEIFNALCKVTYQRDAFLVELGQYAYEWNIYFSNKLSMGKMGSSQLRPDIQRH